MTEPEDNPYAPPPPGWQPPAAPPPSYAAPPGWQPTAPPPPPPPYAGPQGWQPPPSQPPPYGAPPSYGSPPPYGSAAGGYPPYGYQPAYGYPVPGSANGFAIAALLCSILLGVVPFLGGLLGVIFGFVGVRHCARSGERGRGMSIAGIVIGALALAFWILVVVVSLVHHSSDTSTGLGAVMY